MDGEELASIELLFQTAVMVILFNVVGVATLFRPRWVSFVIRCERRVVRGWDSHESVDEADYVCCSSISDEMSWRVILPRALYIAISTLTD